MAEHSYETFRKSLLEGTRNPFSNKHAFPPPISHERKHLLPEPKDVPEGETLSSTIKRWESCQKQWQQSSQWASLRDKLTQHAVTHGLPTIKNVVSTGLGSLSSLGYFEQPEPRERSMYQLAGFLTIINLLTESIARGPMEIDSQPHFRTDTTHETEASSDTISNSSRASLPFGVYAQDPVFTDIDKQLLHNLGITVLEDPDAWNIIDGDALAFMPGAEIIHCWGVAMKKPAVLIGFHLSWYTDRDDCWHPSFDEYNLPQVYRTIEFPEIDKDQDTGFPLYDVGRLKTAYLRVSEEKGKVAEIVEGWLW